MMVLERVRQQMMLKIDADPKTASVRRVAYEKFSEQGLPTIKQEKWKYTSLRILDQFPFLTPTKIEMDAIEIPALPFDVSGRIVFVNGYFDKKLSVLPEEVEISDLPLPELTIDRQLFALNISALTEGMNVTIKENMELKFPIDCVFIFNDNAKDCAIHSCLCIDVKNNSKCDMVMRYIGMTESSYFSNNQIMLNVGENARLALHHIQEQSGQAIHVEHMDISHEKNAQSSIHSLSLGAKIARIDMDSRYLSSHASCSMHGIYRVEEKQHVDYHMNASHEVSHCQTAQHVKGCVAGEARAVFNGRVEVKSGAVKSVSEQSHHGLLLSRRARIDAKPELEIDCDDVQCRHGATVGALRPDALFYLMSRGIPENQAQAMLELAHVTSLLSMIKNQDIQSYMESLLGGRYG